MGKEWVKVKVGEDIYAVLLAVGYLRTGRLWGALQYSAERALQEFAEKHRNDEDVRRLVEMLKQLKGKRFRIDIEVKPAREKQLKGKRFSIEVKPEEIDD